MFQVYSPHEGYIHGRSAKQILGISSKILATKLEISEEELAKALDVAFKKLSENVEYLIDNYTVPDDQQEKVETAVKTGLSLAWDNARFLSAETLQPKRLDFFSKLGGAWLNTALIHKLPKEETDRIHADPEYHSEQQHKLIVDFARHAIYYHLNGHNLDIDEGQLITAGLRLGRTKIVQKALETEGVNIPLDP